MLKDVDPQFIKESAIFKKNPLFLNCFLVTPNCHRVAEFGQNVVFVSKSHIFGRSLHSVDMNAESDQLELLIFFSVFNLMLLLA